MYILKQLLSGINYVVHQHGKSHVQHNRKTKTSEITPLESSDQPAITYRVYYIKLINAEDRGKCKTLKLR